MNPVERNWTTIRHMQVLAWSCLTVFTAGQNGLSQILLNTREFHHSFLLPHAPDEGRAIHMQIHTQLCLYPVGDLTQQIPGRESCLKHPVGTELNSLQMINIIDSTRNNETRLPE